MINTKEIQCILDDFSGKTYDLCYKLLERYGSSGEMFEYVCKHYTSPKDSKSGQALEHISNDELDLLKATEGEIINGVLYSTINKCNWGTVSTDNFYSSLWSSICLLYKSTEERAFAFYYIVIDALIPYQFIGKPLTMNNEKYRELINKNEGALSKIKYIRDLSYSQRTEKASLLLNCINSIDEYESKVVVLSQGIRILFGEKEQLPFESIIKELERRLSAADESESC